MGGRQTTINANPEMLFGNRNIHLVSNKCLKNLVIKKGEIKDRRKPAQLQK